MPLSFIALALTSLHPPAKWETLFDGKSTKGWHAYKGTEISPGWEAKDGCLTFTPTDHASDISSDKVYGDFELQIEWKISEGGNSGIMYRADEGHAAAYLTGPEFQVLDDAKHPDGKKAVTSAGSCYGLYACTKKTVKRAGQWNSAKIRAKGNQIEHWLNGTKVVAYVLHSDDWLKRVAESKFSLMPDYGSLKEGHIVLQNHGDPVSYRNIRIRRL